MLHILLLILKVIGIVLLILLGILLSLILLVLFVPLRYVVDIEKKEPEQLQLKMKVSWLLHILTFRLEKGEDLQYRLRAFCIPIKKSRCVDTEEKDDLDIPKTQSEEMPVKEEISKKSVENRRKIEQKDTEEKEEEKIEKTTEEDSDENLEKDVIKDVQEKEQVHGRTEKKGIREWVRQMISYFTSLRQKITGWIQQVKKFLRKITSSKDAAIKQVKRIWTFLNDTKNKAGASVLWNAGKKIFLHIFPKKWKGQFLIGMKNPADTGKIFGLISVVGGIAGFMPPVMPDFEREIFEGKLSMKGRIRIFTLLRIVLATWRDKNVQYLVHYSKKVLSRG